MKRILLVLILLLAFGLGACSSGGDGSISSEAPVTEPQDLPATAPDSSVISPDSPVSSDSPPAEPGAEAPAFAPLPGDSAMTRGNVFIETSELLVMESYPPQIAVHLTGNLPTPCHLLRIEISPPDAENRINLEVYTVVDPNMACIEMLKAFDVRVPLGSFPAGHYSVWINETKIGEFDG